MCVCVHASCMCGCVHCLCVSVSVCMCVCVHVSMCKCVVNHAVNCMSKKSFFLSGEQFAVALLKSSNLVTRV